MSLSLPPRFRARLFQVLKALDSAIKASEAALAALRLQGGEAAAQVRREPPEQSTTKHLHPHGNSNGKDGWCSGKAPEHLFESEDAFVEASLSASTAP